MTRALRTLALVASLGTASCADRPACAPCGPTPACVTEASAATIPPSASAVVGADHAPKLEASSEPASAGAPQTLGVLVTITRDGELLVDGAHVATPAQIGELARSAKKRDPELRAVVAADESATHGAVMAVVDALKSAGVTRIAFAVAPAAGVTPQAPPR